MPVHAGSRLKKIISDKYPTVKEFADLMGWSKQKMTYYFQSEHIKPRTLKLILVAIGIDERSFWGITAYFDTKTEIDELNKKLEQCQEENRQLSKEMIDLQRELLTEKKPTKTGKVIR